MEQKCGNCLLLDLYDHKETRDLFSGIYEGYYCKEERKYMNPQTDGHYCRYFKEKADSNSSGCFITTVVVYIMGYSDDCKYLKTLRDFRDNYLKQNNDDLELLKLYDVVGPIIACNIAHDNNRRLLGLNLFSNYIAPCCELITLGKYEEAKALYKSMVNYLQIKYNISMNPSNYIYDSNVEIGKIGKGRARVHKVNVNC